MEAVNLPLEGTDLVTLSACETGLGEIKHGEGVYGLQRAFLAAGAESVLMSLWKVSDEETATFMIELYRRLSQGLSVREAYRQTLREMQKRFPAPFHWGAFVLLETGKGL
jgi:CHAT domain-containing protein